MFFVINSLDTEKAYSEFEKDKQEDKSIKSDIVKVLQRIQHLRVPGEKMS